MTDQVPAITVPRDMVFEAITAVGALEEYAVTTQHDVDGTATIEEDNGIAQNDIIDSIRIYCNTPSGFMFRIRDTIE